MKKKAAFIGHSYHERTGSSAFFQDFLREEFSLDTFDSELGNPEGFEYQKLLQTSYDYYFFWQTEHIAAQISNYIGGKTIIIPMYDGALQRSSNFWRAFPRSIFISFSAKLHSILQEAQCSSVHIRYFPEPGERCWDPESSPSGFFWERRPSEAYDGRAVIAAAAQIGLKRLHVHLPRDFAENVGDRREALAKIALEHDPNLELTYSDWFPDRAEMRAEANRHAVYFAPRLMEGIGMSFLEAMAAGQIVVGPDEPTLNEYVVDGETGFLLNGSLSFNQAPDLDVEELQAMSDLVVQRMHKSHAQWLEDRERLMGVIRRGYIKSDADSGSQFERYVRDAAGRRS